MKDEALDRELDKLAGKVFRVKTLDVPSADFTSKVMSRIEVAGHRNITAYVPLISGKVWGIFGFGLLCVLLCPFLTEDANKVELWKDYIELPEFQLPGIFGRLPAMFLPDNLVYGILAFTLFLYVQIFVLKKYLDERT